MSVDLELAPKQKRPKGEVCCDPVVYPDIERTEAERIGDELPAPGADVLGARAGASHGQGPILYQFFDTSTR